MKNPAIFFCGLMLGLTAAIGGFVLVDRAHAAPTSGPFMINEHSNPTATAGVFRVNVNSGAVSYCYIDSSAKPQVTCTAETP
jgi:hypothetical protein